MTDTDLHLSPHARPAAPFPRAAGRAEELAALKVVPARSVGRWVASAVVLVLVAMFVHGLATNPGWDWSTFGDYFTEHTVLRALLLTLKITGLAAVFGFLGGVLLAAMRLSRSTLLQTVSWTFVWAFRSIPLIVQLLFWGNLAYLYQRVHFGVPFGPHIFGIETHSLLSPFGAAVLGLSLNQAAFSAEIVRSGIISVDQGQTEAAHALGLPRFRTFRRIVLPQAMRTILPTAANELITLIKMTSVVFVLALPELFYQVQVIYGRNARVVPLLIVATVWYIVLTTVLSIGQYYLERHFARGALRTLPPTPLQRLRTWFATVRGVRA